MSFALQNTQENEILLGQYSFVFPTKYCAFICIVIEDFEHVTSQFADFPNMCSLVFDVKNILGFESKITHLPRFRNAVVTFKEKFPHWS